MTEKLRVDLGCGNNKKEGFTGVDITMENTQADIAHDLSVYPWPFADGSVDELFSSHNFEHIPQLERGKYMDEAHRCLRRGGTFELVTPYAWSHRAIQDFTHMWPPIVFQSYLYFDKRWREESGLTHWAYDLKCDFEIVRHEYCFAGDEIERVINGHEDKAERLANNINVAEDMTVVLRKR